ncbi:MAG TPA: hypothetical protein DHV59_17065 [Oxalobacteraceae bacterium]|nr:hypothetical protein [Oxalobacteraceae bacterium]
MNQLCIDNQQSGQTIQLANEERQPCEIWTRVMGYHRPMSSFNIGKKGEFHERQYFTERSAQLG